MPTLCGGFIVVCIRLNQALVNLERRTIGNHEWATLDRGKGELEKQ